MTHLTVTYTHLEGKSSPSDNEVTVAIECNVDHIYPGMQGLKIQAILRVKYKYIPINIQLYML